MQIELQTLVGSSDVFKIGLVTYSNEYKIKFGVNAEKINKYTVYSKEIAREMAKNVKKIANSSIGIGITGQIGDENINNVYVSIIYENEFIDFEVKAKGKTRVEKKNLITEEICNSILELI